MQVHSKFLVGISNNLKYSSSKTKYKQDRLFFFFLSGYFRIAELLSTSEGEDIKRHGDSLEDRKNGEWMIYRKNAIFTVRQP